MIRVCEYTQVTVDSFALKAYIINITNRKERVTTMNIKQVLADIRLLNPETDMKLITHLLSRVTAQVEQDNKDLQARLLGKCVGNNRVH